MEFSGGGNENPIALSCDGDPTIREGGWLRLWNSLGVGVAHEVLVVSQQTGQLPRRPPFAKYQVCSTVCRPGLRNH